MPLLGEVLDAFERLYEPAWADSWDAVGLVCGDREAPVRRILLAIDPLPLTVAEALAGERELMITHHPLLLSPVHGVPADDPKGALIHRLIRGGCALYTAHTNADVADPGVSDALAARLGLRDTRPVVAAAAQPLDKLVVFVPQSDADRLIDALAAAGAGRLGDYERCAWRGAGLGTFRPLSGARPAIGALHEISEVPEDRVEMVVPAARRAAVIAALRAAHPYEEPAFDLLAAVPLPTRRGHGRIGRLAEAMPLARFAALAAAALPATAVGVRAAGDPHRLIRTVAVCGGAGGSLADAARAAGADALLTADLKHHASLEAAVERDGLALLDATHWATEAPWLDLAAEQLRARWGTTVEVLVSHLVTDPWTLQVAAPQPDTGIAPSGAPIAESSPKRP